MNEYDSNRILDLTKKINYVLTKNIAEANCYILNTCHIREKATDKVYHDIGRVKKENYIDAVIGPQSYHKINDMILNLEKKI